MNSFFAARIATLSLAAIAGGPGCDGDSDSNREANRVVPSPDPKGVPKPNPEPTFELPGPPCPDGVPAASAGLNIAMIAQQSSNLCWAAVTAMIARSFDKAVPGQCKQIMDRDANCGPTGTQHCDNCPASINAPLGPCNNGGWLDLASIGLQAQETVEAALPLQDLKKEIACRGRPVAFTWHLGAESALHIMLAYGYDGSDIWIHDPLPPCVGVTKVIPYTEYVDGHVPGTTWHSRDYYDLRKIETTPP